VRTIPQIITERLNCRRYGEAQMRELYDTATAIGDESGNWELARALDCGTNEDIIRELCAYLRTNGNSPFVPFLVAYVPTQNWIV
jgi:hypothetical protein